jgi:hypothetical protein
MMAHEAFPCSVPTMTDAQALCCAPQGQQRHLAFNPLFNNLLIIPLNRNGRILFAQPTGLGELVIRSQSGRTKCFRDIIGVSVEHANEYRTEM